MIIDMHAHSTCSDGQYAPMELLEKAVSHGINYFSITDHDTVQAYFHIVDHFEQFQSLLKTTRDFTYIPGCELSVNSAVDGKKHHLCVYFPGLSLSSGSEKPNIDEDQYK